MELTSGLASTPNSLVAAAIETQKKNVGLSPSPEGGFIVVGQIDSVDQIDSVSQFTRSIKPKTLGHSVRHFIPAHFGPGHSVAHFSLVNRGKINLTNQNDRALLNLQ